LRNLQRSWLPVTLLAGVLLRALIPAGFMPGAQGLAFCPGESFHAGISKPQDSAHHPPGHRMPDSPPAKGTGGGCAFAGSSASIASFGIANASPEVGPSPAVLPIERRPASRPAIMRAQTPRGPPV
jgi:hypothetical protein